ncbi:hypothetical protein V8E53_003995 [Lactarius tabidus]
MTPLLWNVTHYSQASLQLLGFSLCLGHSGAPSSNSSGDTPAQVGTKRSGDSGNLLFTVVNRSGIFNMEIVFCVCSEGNDMDAQFLRAGLFPSTFKQTETLFTVSVLEDFLTDNLECKTTVQQYYSKLQSMTNRMFPNNVPESGIRHMKEGEPIPDGSMAVFCPACRQPSINLPMCYDLITNDKLIWTFIMDSNFSAEHMQHRSRERDVSLSAGMAFMANPEPYKSHLQTGKEIIQPSTCNTYRAIEQANSSRTHLDVTESVQPLAAMVFLQINMDYSICRALSFNMEDIPVALVMYDIMCQYQVNFHKRVKNSPELSITSSLELRKGIRLFHIHGHQDSCLPRFSPSYIPGAKQVDGEIIETLWAPLNNISRSLQGMSLAHRQEVLDAHINHSNWKKPVQIGMSDPSCT